MSFSKWSVTTLVALGFAASTVDAQESTSQPPTAADGSAGQQQLAQAEPQPLAAEPAEVQPAASTAVTASEPAPSATEETATLPGPVESPAAPAWLPEWTRNIKLGGGAILYYYQPLQKNQKNDLSFFYGHLIIDANAGDFALHLEPRFRDGKLRSYYDGPAWLQEAYASWSPGAFAKLKVGKVYSHLGLFWDNSFYGNVQVYDGLKLDPDYGVSLEGTIGDRLGINYWAQFFIVDGRTNVSQPGRDTISIPGARRRNTFVLNVEPFWKFGSDGHLRVGGSLEAFKADLPSGDDNVLRLAAHAKITVGSFGAWAEIQHQNGRHVDAFPVAAVPATDGSAAVAGRASGDNTYFELGAEYTLSNFTVRYNVSRGNYADVKTYEWLNVPAIAYRIAAPLTIQAELALWRRHAPDANSWVDKSLNVTLIGEF